MVHKTRALGVTLAVFAATMLAAACGSSSPNGASGGQGAGSANARPAALAGPTTGPGLTTPTAPSGARMAGGTVYFTEGADAPPTYIFPMYDFAECTTTNNKRASTSRSSAIASLTRAATLSSR